MRYREEDRSAGETILDKLLWHESHAQEPGRRGNAFVDSIARDLEVLMNSRRSDEEELLEAYPEVSTSILNFGMPALGRYGNIGTAAEQNRLRGAIEETVRIFEPRLRKPQVRVAPADAQHANLVRFALEATVDGLGTRELFELRLKPATGEMTVAASAGA